MSPHRHIADFAAARMSSKPSPWGLMLSLLADPICVVSEAYEPNMLVAQQQTEEADPRCKLDRMNDAGLYGLMADAILVLHFAFVVFVVFGFMLILIGLLVRWSWRHNRKFRISHLAAIGFVVLQAWLGQLCPLTIWENELRRRAGQSGYTETFVEHWLRDILFYQAEPWVFTTIYTCFGTLVVIVWFRTGQRPVHDAGARSPGA